MFALFPADPADNYGYLCTSYQHIGQHCGADYDLCIRASRPATRREAAPLLTELRRIGYRPPRDSHGQAPCTAPNAKPPREVRHEQRHCLPPVEHGQHVLCRQQAGDDGVDWGYHTDPKKAIPLSTYWQRRFAADCRRVGVTARFTPVNGEKQP